MHTIDQNEISHLIRQENALVDIITSLHFNKHGAKWYDNFVTMLNPYGIYQDKDVHCMRKKTIMSSLEDIRDCMMGYANYDRLHLHSVCKTLVRALYDEKKRIDTISKADTLATTLEPLFAVSGIIDNEHDRTLLMNVATAMSLRVLTVIWNAKRERKRVEALKSTFNKFCDGKLTSLQFRAHIRAIFFIK